MINLIDFHSCMDSFSTNFLKYFNKLNYLIVKFSKQYDNYL